MSDVKFVLETVSNAFGPGNDIPWHEAKRETFPTLVKAQAAYDADLEEMVERCGPGMAWDSHRRIVPAEDTTAIYNLVCGGVLGGEFCPGQKGAKVTVAWPAGELRPLPEPPDGWYSVFQCDACAEREAVVRKALYAEYDQEREQHANR